MRLVVVYGWETCGALMERKLVEEEGKYFDFVEDYELTLEELKEEGYVLDKDEAYKLQEEYNNSIEFDEE